VGGDEIGDLEVGRAVRASAVLVAGVPVAAWLLLPVAAPDEGETVALDVRRLDRELEWALGLGAAALVVWALWVIYGLPGRWRQYRSVRTAIPLAAATLYGVFTLWGMTQPTHGANIGGGMIFLTACVVVPALIGVAAWAAWGRAPT
jgi:hypothetical protein